MTTSYFLRICITATLTLCALAPCCTAEGVKVETVLTGLSAPSAVAIRPGPSGAYEVYVAESGTGRIVKLRSDQPSAGSEAIRGLPAGAEGGTIGLLFLDRERLAVIGTGKSAHDRPLVRLYELPLDDKPLPADETKQHIDLPANSNPPAADALERFALARTRSNDHVPDMLLVISPETWRSRQFSRIPVRAGTLGELGVFPLVNERTTTDVPTAIAVNDQGYVVIAFSNSATPSAGRLAFVNPIDGAVVMELTTDLPDVVGLAYSTTSPQVYALAAPRTAGSGGVYRIDDASQAGKPACRAIKLADLPQPTAMAFGPDGALYVTSLDESADTSTTPARLLKLTGEF